MSDMLNAEVCDICPGRGWGTSVALLRFVRLSGRNTGIRDYTHFTSSSTTRSYTSTILSEALSCSVLVKLLRNTFKIININILRMKQHENKDA